MGGVGCQRGILRPSLIPPRLRAEQACRHEQDERGDFRTCGFKPFAWSNGPVFKRSERRGAGDGYGFALATLESYRPHRLVAAAWARVQSGDVIIDLDRRLVARNGEPVRLTPQGVRAARSPCEACWQAARPCRSPHGGLGTAHVADTRYLRIVIGQLRQKLEDDPAQPNLIVTEPGVGYRLRA